jgi:putative spermidine/putrescine transport system ATP-binding protein
MTKNAGIGHLRLEGLCQRYGAISALRDVSLDVQAGEFVTLLGPSGSGKTTTLKIVAGFLRPDSGRVILDGKDITDLPPHLRDIGMVFQNYALFPHLTVARNVAFPLEMRRMRKSEITRIVESGLALVQLAAFGDRRPRELSGGQQQRVALARALVFQPSVLLMDEPLGALDRKLREAMQLEIINICREVGHTVLYVTHDQEEALAMSDQIAVYHEGRIEQIGTPESIYRYPATLFVATFVGESTTFFGKLERSGSESRLRADGISLPVSASMASLAGIASGSPAALVVRPEAISMRRLDSGVAFNGTRSLATIRGRVLNCVYLGSARKSVIALDGGTTALVRVPQDDASCTIAELGHEVEICWDVEAGIIVSPDGGAAPTRAIATTGQETEQ